MRPSDDPRDQYHEEVTRKVGISIALARFTSERRPSADSKNNQARSRTFCAANRGMSAGLPLLVEDINTSAQSGFVSSGKNHLYRALPLGSDDRRGFIPGRIR
jgi:hypothetical protein